MAFYIKVTTRVAERLGASEIRNTTADGNVLLWQADIDGISGDTVFIRAANVGGVCLTAQEARSEIDGTDNPIAVDTPEEYLPAPNEKFVEPEYKATVFCEFTSNNQPNPEEV